MLTAKSLQLRPTIMPNSSDCNLRCGYCYCHHKTKNNGFFMKDNIMKAAMKKFLEAYPRYISFCWHGGEPLLSGLKFFNKVILAQKEYFIPNQKIENRLQTNAVLINKEWVDFFKKFDFKIGISIDGPSWLNDNQRKDINGKKTFDKIMNGINMLRENNIPFSVLITVTNKTVLYPEQVYKFITNQQFPAVKLNPCFGDNPFGVEFKEYARFMNKIFDLWFEEDRTELSFGHIGDIFNGLLGGNPKTCHIRSSCYRHVKIDYNGDVVPCDKFLGEDFKFGNIVSQDIEEIINGNRFKKFFELVSIPPEKCKKCKWLNVCGGGCSRHSFDGSTEKHHNNMCECKQIMFNHISKAIKQHL